MAYSIANNHLLRKHFQEIKRIIDIPNLIDIQKNSYQRFLQAELPPSARQNIGLEAVFRSVFPIKDFSETCSLEYVSYTLGTPKYDVEECHQRGMTFAAPMKVKVRLVVWDVDKETDVQSIQRHQGAGGLFRRNSADDRQRHLHHQRHRTGYRQPAASLARGVLSTMTRGRPIPAAKSSIPPGSSRIAVPGSISSSTIRTSSMCASTAAAKCRPRCCSRRSATRAKSC